MIGAKTEKTNLIEKIRQIFDNAHRLKNRIPDSGSIAFSEIIYILFGEYDSPEDKERHTVRLRRKGNPNSRRINAEDINKFVANNLSIDDFVNRLLNVLGNRRHNKNSYYFYDVSVYEEIFELYRSINPYPWFDYTEQGESTYNEDTEDIHFMIIQLLLLFVHSLYCPLKAHTDSTGEQFFTDSTGQHLILDAPLCSKLGNYFCSHPPMGVENVYLINMPIQTYEQVLSAIRPDYDFWKEFQRLHTDKEDRFYNLNPFVNHKPSECLKHLLKGSDLLIIDAPICPKDLDWINKLPCKLLYIANNLELICQDETPVIAMQKYLPDIISSITDDDKEAGLLLKLSNKIGPQSDIYSLLHTYYRSYEGDKAGEGEKLLETLIHADTLEQGSSALAAYKKTVSLLINGEKSGRQLQNALALLYSRYLDDNERELIRFFCQLQEADFGVSLETVCNLLNQNTLYEKMISLGWADASRRIPCILAAAFTYRPNMTNRNYDAYLELIFNIRHIMLGYTLHPINKDLICLLIRVLHEENLSYLADRSENIVRTINKSYIKKFLKKYQYALPENYCNSDCELLYYRNHGYFPDANIKEKLDHVTEKEFLNKTLLTEFYYAAIIFCYEYDQHELAEYLYQGITDNPAVLGFNNMPSKVGKNEEYQIFCSCYQILFSSNNVNERRRDLLEMLCKCLQKTNPAVAKPVLRVFLRHDLMTMQMLLYRYFSGLQKDIEEYKIFVFENIEFLKNTKALLSNVPGNTYASEEAALLIHHYILLILGGSKDEWTASDVDGSNTYYMLHRVMHKAIQRFTQSAAIDILQAQDELVSIGNIPEITQNLLTLLSFPK